MNKTIKIICHGTLFLIFCVGCLGLPFVHASSMDNARWSFDFEKSTVSEALEKIGTDTGIKIFINGDIDGKILSKSYFGTEIEQIIKDIFRNQNCAIVWRYDQNGLESIDIVVVQGSIGDSKSRPDNFLIGKQRNNQKRKNVHSKNATKSQNHNSYASSYVSSKIPLNGSEERVSPSFASTFATSESKKAQADTTKAKKIVLSGAKNTAINQIGILPAPPTHFIGTGMDQALVATPPPPIPEPSQGFDSTPNPPSPTTGDDTAPEQASVTTPPPPIPEPSQGFDSTPNPSSSTTDEENAPDQGSTKNFPPPVPEKWRGLEPPPMPPGFTSAN